MNVEILSPAGSFESAVAALRSGCNAIYVGSKNFSARANANNFTSDELEQIVKLCHKYGVKVYQAINTLLTDDELPLCAEEIKHACEIGIDGIISQDLAVLKIVKTACPDMEIHASTQMTIHSPSSVDFAVKSGFSRVVVARELSKEQLKKCCNRGAEIEAFVHGALCMSVSGQCYMSAMIGSRSANRGRCAQACRLPFSNHINNENALSLKDMCLVPYLKEMTEIGISSLKIEGRMKRPEYVAGATDACVKSLNNEVYDLSALKSVFSRSGFTDGYYTSKRDNMFGIRRKEDVLETDEVLPKFRELYRKERKVCDINFKILIKNGENIKLFAYDNNGNMSDVEGTVPEKALKRAVDKEFCEKQLSKLGDTIYRFNNLDCQIDEGLSVSAGELNALRREVCQKLDKVRTENNTKKVNFDGEKLFFFYPKYKNIKLRIPRLDVTKASQLRGVDLEEVDMAIVPLKEIDHISGLDIDKLCVSLPRFILDEEIIISQLKKAYSLGIKKSYISNYAHIEMCEKIGFEMHGDFGLNVTNSMALEELANKNLMSVTLSPELKMSQIRTIADFTRLNIIGYGNLPVMLTRNCPIGNCNKCKGFLTDRTGRKFQIKCEKNWGYTEVLNCDTLWLGDKVRELDADFVTLKFSKESPQEVANILQKFLNGDSYNGKFTRGLYYRGIL